MEGGRRNNMKKYKFFVSTNKVGSDISDVLEFDDDVTEEEVRGAYEDWIWEKLNTGWGEVE